MTHFKKSNTDIKDKLHSCVFSIPVGLSYTYKNIELDARYLWGISKVADTKDKNDKDLKNSTFAITLGYRFGLLSPKLLTRYMFNQHKTESSQQLSSTQPMMSEEESLTTKFNKYKRPHLQQ